MKRSKTRYNRFLFESVWKISRYWQQTWRNRIRMDPEDMLNRYEKRFGPYFTEPVVAGLDGEHKPQHPWNLTPWARAFRAHMLSKVVQSSAMFTNHVFPELTNWQSDRVIFVYFCFLLFSAFPRYLCTFDFIGCLSTAEEHRETVMLLWLSFMRRKRSTPFSDPFREGDIFLCLIYVVNHNKLF